MWKITRDSYYSDLCQKFGYDFIVKAGFFEDTDEVNRKVADSISILCTPLSFLKKGATKPAILLSTGSFCPIHYGHLQMMESAKKAVEDAGYTVIGGYFSPSHDEYVQRKTGEGGWIPDFHRLTQIKNVSANHPWIQIDPWEAVFNKVAINFTDVIDRLEQYVLRHTGIDADIFYVCGGDNARFALTFALKGHCVIVNRPGYAGKIPQEYQKDLQAAIHSKRIVMAEGSANVSSSEIRDRHGSPTFLNKTTLQLRLDECSVAETSILPLIEKQFREVQVHRLNHDQVPAFNKLSKDKMVSLDPLLPGSYNLPISRHYDLYGATKIRHGVRPDSCDTLEDHIKKIPIGTYTLFDDDIHSGRTMQFAKKLLEDAGHTIDQITSLTRSDGIGEILDARDFLLGSGLVVELPNQQLVRLPYVYPYVCPFIRGSIVNPKQFSIDVWKTNASIHRKSGLMVKDLPGLALFARYMGYAPDKSLASICEEHAEMLSQVF